MSDTNEQQILLAETVEKLFRDLMADGMPDLQPGQLPPQWQPLEDNGITAVFVPESAGGFGGGWQDAFIVLNAAGFHALPLPLAETLLAQHLLIGADLPVPAGAIAIAAAADARLQRDGAAWTLDCGAAEVPWGDSAGHTLVVCDYEGAPHLALVARAACAATAAGHSVAKEPLADLAFAQTPAQAAPCDRDVFALCALARSAQIAGALNAALRQSVEYANERKQFGRAIGKFQAVQHALAQLADEAAAVNCAALSACRAADLGDAGFEIAAAKLRANRAVGIATSVAHQVHGAIGFTREHSLHRATQRLWAWRSQYGNDRFWAGRLGTLVAERGAAQFWPDLTARSDRG